MKEDFLHYLWRFKKFETLDLRTTQNEPLIIIKTGDYLELSGPDFFNAQIIIENQKWAGNIEIHLKSSDWYVHGHEKDTAYDNVILHVVWEHDTEIFGKNNIEIPVLVLKEYTSKEMITNYNALIAPKSWIFCEKSITEVDEFVFKNWQERLFFERLERKAIFIYDLLEEYQQDWEEVLFSLFARNFGLNTNGNSFLQMAKSLPFSIVRKESFEVENLEALFFGTIGLLDADKEDVYFTNLKIRYYYLLNKYQLKKRHIDPIQFYKHRPDNFPTIRLSQLANLYQKQNLFSKIIAAKSVEEVRKLLIVSANPYWQNHYQFDRESSRKPKALSRAFIDLLIINTIIPLQFAYAATRDESIAEELISFMNQVAPESNAIISKFELFGVKAENAFETQALLELKKEYCNQKACLRCALGIELLKNN
ncbi:DUF2851 family protein [Flavobacterium tructae]|uniref:DUF2851 family protein n=1 Tax=Flavobacterium tructae TaxID=1114873 RepID=A0A1S1JCU6_9FLAO|nr:DUF2851 family protein [Flavobacterium tructae]OHT47374.1 hypothetical protein BHE19_20210 [Flavobacterium tructae]OXB19655.1 hypothetical protein B0A71_09380 [Flavobacterium tructae]